MKIPRSRIREILAAAPRFTRKPRHLDLPRLLRRLREDLRTKLAEHMQPCMVLLDESVQFFIHFERHLYSKKLTSASSQFALQISRLRSDAIAIRETIAIGQEAAASVLARAFLEGIELAMALAVDESFAKSYSETDDQSAFWRRQIGYGNIYRMVEEFLSRAGLQPSDIDSVIRYHKQVKDALSAHVHGAPHSALRSAAIPSISHPGLLHVNSLGELSAHLPMICLFVATTTQTFSGGCIKLIIKPNPPAAFAATTTTGRLSDAIASAHLIQELLAQYGDDIQNHYDSLLNAES